MNIARSLGLPHVERGIGRRRSFRTAQSKIWLLQVKCNRGSTTTVGVRAT